MLEPYEYIWLAPQLRSFFFQYGTMLLLSGPFEPEQHPLTKIYGVVCQWNEHKEISILRRVMFC